MDSRIESIAWAGRGELIPWPEVDWWLLTRDDSWQPIFDVRPRTSAELWARRITGRDGRDGDDGIQYTTSIPKTINGDVWQRIRVELARRTREGRVALGEMRLSEPVAPPLVPVRATDQDANRERSIAVEVKRADQEVVFCSLTNKIRHRSKLWALVHRNRLMELPDAIHPERLEAYKCKGCGDWHVGHRA